jgi:hypothetical protein
MMAADLESKRLEVLKDVVPSVTKVMVLHDLSMGTGTADAVRHAAQSLGLKSSSPKRRIRCSRQMPL